MIGLPSLSMSKGLCQPVPSRTNETNRSSPMVGERRAISSRLPNFPKLLCSSETAEGLTGIPAVLPLPELSVESKKTKGPCHGNPAASLSRK